MANGTLIVVTIPVFILLFVPWALRVWVHQTVTAHICKDLTGVPKIRFALVLGASLGPKGSPTAMLYDRVATAADLYKTEIVKKLLISGANSSVNYNEPAVMKRLAIQMGVREEDIVLDLAGLRTYDSCYRARHTFELERVILVTQKFHLDRSLYLCKALGIESVGVAADRQPHDGLAYLLCRLRETLALVLAWVEVNVFRPTPR